MGIKAVRQLSRWHLASDARMCAVVMSETGIVSLLRVDQSLRYENVLEVGMLITVAQGIDLVSWCLLDKVFWIVLLIM